jgi:phosphohistidine phosphatase SixA
VRLLLALLVLLAAGCGGATAPDTPERLDAVQLVEALQEGGLVVYLRHAATDRSKEDDTVVDFGDCSTQRNLNDAGREQARTIGEAFRELEIPVDEVLASEYCRTRETGELAFGSVELEPDLTGFPNRGEPTYEQRVARTRELLGEDAGDGNVVLVAHIKNIEAAAGVSIEEGELAVFEPAGGGEFRHLGDIPASAWPQLAEKLGPGS